MVQRALEPPSPTNKVEVRLSPDAATNALERAFHEPPAGRIPISTYRVQFGENFTFADARRWAHYLHRLGVGDLYSSPFFHATSPHGYDINDHNRVNPALSGEASFQGLLAELRDLGLGHVMDVVPNHMGIASGENVWWNDVLENGQASPYAHYFDIDWYPLRIGMEGKVLLPILGDQYGRVLERGDLRLEIAQGAFFLRYGERLLPIAPRTYAAVLQRALERLQPQLAADDPAIIELQSIITAIGHLPERTETEPEQVAERLREKEVIKRRILSLMESSNAARVAIEAAVAEFNGTPGDPRSFDRLDALLADQAYRPAFWRVAAEEINYRRFFDINELAAIRMQQAEVFRETHRLVMRLVALGAVAGLRIDHPDGLWDPEGYFAELQRAATLARAEVSLAAQIGLLEEAELALLERVSRALRSRIAAARPLYIVAEKILEHGEQLPAAWAVHGTTGYDFLNVLNGLFVDRASERHVTQTYQRLIDEGVRFDELVYQSKRLILRTAMASELNVLAYALGRLSERDRHYRDFTLGSLTAALREVIATFPVYRSYIDERTGEVDQHDRIAIETAIRRARRRNPELDPSIFEFLRDLLVLQLPDAPPEELVEQRHFVMRFQQLTGPVMAKGVEDTAFYRYNRLVSLNEVGGDPSVFGTTPAEFHDFNLERQQRWPHAMLTTSSHDTKRSEDVRARISVLSEMPESWRAALGRWSRRNRAKKREVEDDLFPSRNDEYLLYQTLLGVWPLEPLDQQTRKTFVERIVAYMAKAAKEAKAHTSWINPDPAYDQALEHFVRAVLADERFLADFLPLQHQVAHFGAINSLAQVTLKLAAPGVPDIYQGNEMWNFSLVDPDNRRPIDFEAHEATLEALERAAESRGLQDLARELVQQWPDGRIKLWVTARALHHRRDHSALYQDGGYQPVAAAGPAAEHIVAFARTLGQQTLVVVVPRLMRRLAVQVASSTDGPEAPILGAEPWRGTTLSLPPGRYRNVFTGEVLTSNGAQGADEIFAVFPVGLLEKEE